MNRLDARIKETVVTLVVQCKRKCFLCFWLCLFGLEMSFFGDQRSQNVFDLSSLSLESYSLYWQDGCGKYSFLRHSGNKRARFHCYSKSRGFFSLLQLVSGRLAPYLQRFQHLSRNERYSPSLEFQTLPRLSSTVRTKISTKCFTCEVEMKATENVSLDLSIWKWNTFGLKQVMSHGCIWRERKRRQRRQNAWGQWSRTALVPARIQHTKVSRDPFLRVNHAVHSLHASPPGFSRFIRSRQKPFMVECWSPKCAGRHMNETVTAPRPTLHQALGPAPALPNRTSAAARCVVRVS